MNRKSLSTEFICKEGEEGGRVGREGGRVGREGGREGGRVG